MTTISLALQQLYGEHQVILSKLDDLSMTLLKSDDDLHSQEVQEFITFFREYGDGYHHRKEEDILFPLLVNANEGVRPIIESLTEHHEQFRETLASAVDAMGREDWNEVRRVLGGYISDLRDHISAEDDELFVAADDSFTPAEKQRLHYQFIDQDTALGLDRKRQLESVNT